MKLQQENIRHKNARILVSVSVCWYCRCKGIATCMNTADGIHQGQDSTYWRSMSAILESWPEKQLESQLTTWENLTPVYLLTTTRKNRASLCSEHEEARVAVIHTLFPPSLTGWRLQGRWPAPARNWPELSDPFHCYGGSWKARPSCTYWCTSTPPSARSPAFRTGISTLTRDKLQNFDNQPDKDNQTDTVLQCSAKPKGRKLCSQYS